jgi:hypothetical protein
MTDTMRLRFIRKPASIAALFLIAVAFAPSLYAQSLDIPSKTWGISFGNSKSFTGLRFNFRDYQVERVTGVNFTLWAPRKFGEDNKGAVVRGLSLGPIPGGGDVRGVQLGILGAMADEIRSASASEESSGSISAGWASAPGSTSKG